MQKQTLIVDEDNHHLRLDVFLTRNLQGDFTRTFLRKIIDAGRVNVNQKIEKAHHKVCIGDEVIIELKEGESPLDDLLPENIPLNIFYEDESILVINKPIGLLVHPVPGQKTGTLVNALLYYCKELSDVNAKFRPGIVHRLDRETSGLMIVAKNNKCHVRMARQFEKRRVKKKYVALVAGSIDFDEGVIEAPLGRHPRQFDKRAVAFDSRAKEATTFYRVIDRLDGTRTLVALFPQSGRTHQLRVHMAYLGHSILGDDKYGDKNSFSRLALHAQSIAFTHPETREFMEFSSPVPRGFYH